MLKSKVFLILNARGSEVQDIQASRDKFGYATLWYELDEQMFGTDTPHARLQLPIGYEPAATKVLDDTTIVTLASASAETEITELSVERHISRDASYLLGHHREKSYASSKGPSMVRDVVRKGFLGLKSQGGRA
jgi:hypothetical protein